MVYQIQPYSFEKARQLGVEIKPSKKANKKIDVFKQGALVASIGDIKSLDYPSYIKTKGQEYANERQRLFKLRFNKYSQKINSPAYYSSNILW